MINYKDEESVEFKEPSEIVLLRLLDYIGKKEEGSISDYILDFCEVNSYHIEDVAELISNNKNIKTLLKEDCIFNGILKSNKIKIKIDEW